MDSLLSAITALWTLYLKAVMLYYQMTTTTLKKKTDRSVIPRVVSSGINLMVNDLENLTNSELAGTQGLLKQIIPDKQTSRIFCLLIKDVSVVFAGD